MLKMEEQNSTSNPSNRSPKTREAREAATGLFVKAKISETRATEAAKMARLRALRLAKEAADREPKVALKKPNNRWHPAARPPQPRSYDRSRIFVLGRPIGAAQQLQKRTLKMFVRRQDVAG